MVIGSNYMG